MNETITLVSLLVTLISLIFAWLQYTERRTIERHRDIDKVLDEALMFKKDGHFVLSSGNHGTTYYQVRVALSNEECARKIAHTIVRHYEDQPYPNIIVAWTIGGLFVADALAEWLPDSRILIADRTVDDKHTPILPNFPVLNERHRVLVVDDIVTTGDTLRKLKALLRERCRKGEVKVAVVVRLYKRILPMIRLPSRFYALSESAMAYWPENVCRLSHESGAYVDMQEANVDPRPTLRMLESRSGQELTSFRSGLQRLLTSPRLASFHNAQVLQTIRQSVEDAKP